MNETSKQPTATAPAVEVKRSDLPAYCPTDAMGLWNSHPKVYIPLEESPEANCPYCGTQFVLVEK